MDAMDGVYDLDVCNAIQLSVLGHLGSAHALHGPLQLTHRMARTGWRAICVFLPLAGRSVTILLDCYDPTCRVSLTVMLLEHVTFGPITA